MIDDPFAFSEAWITDWNSHDIERILAHYSDRIVFASPAATRIVGSGVIEGKSALRRYWMQALANFPELRFKLDEVFIGHGAITITYHGLGGRRVAETLEFDTEDRVIRAYAAYAQAERQRSAPA